MVASVVQEWRQAPTGPFVSSTDVGWVSRGTGATLRGLFARDQDLIWVTDFMTAAEQADAYNGTLLFDHQPAIQAALDYAIYRNELADSGGGPRVRMPGGVMRIDSPVNVGYGIDFRSCIFEGEGPRYGGTVHKQGVGTCLIQTFNNAPGVVVQGGRNVTLRNFAMLGPNGAWVFNLVAAAQMNVLDVANWIDPAFPSSASSRHAPLAGIAIDPYGGARPGVSYPDVPYPVFLGAQSQYNKALSSNTTIENVTIDGYFVSVVQQPCDADGNGDFTHLNRVIMLNSAYGFSWGNSQARTQSLRDCAFDSVHTTLSSTVFGRRIGQPGVACYSTAWSRNVQMLDMPNLNYGQGPSFYGCYAEAIYKIGRVGQGAEAGGSTLFSGCELGFSWWLTYGVPVYIFENLGLSVTTFDSVLFTGAGADFWGAFAFNSLDFNSNGETGRSFSFKGCSVFAPAGPPTQRWAQCAYNATQGFSFAKAATYLESFIFRAANIFNLDSGANLGQFLFDACNEGPRSRGLPVYSKRAKSIGSNGDPGIPVAFIPKSIEANGAGGVITQSGRNITFTFSGVDADYLSYAGGGVGDVLKSRATGATFWVYARTGTVFSARAQSGFGANGNLLTALPNGDVFDTINCRYYCPGGAEVLYADMASGSGTLTAVVNGNVDPPASIGTYVSVGDWFWANHDVDEVVNPFGGNGRITVIDEGAKTIQVGGAFKQDLAHRRLGILIRPEMANGTPT